MTQGIGIKERWQNPEWRKDVTEKIRKAHLGMRGAKRTEPSKKKTSETIKKWHENMSDEVREERRQKLSEATKRHYEKKKLSPEYIEKKRLIAEVIENKKAENERKREIVRLKRDEIKLSILRRKEEARLKRDAAALLKLKAKNEGLALRAKKKEEKEKSKKIRPVSNPISSKIKLTKEEQNEIRSRRLKDYYAQNPDARKEASERLKKYYQDHPEVRKKMSEARIRYVQAHPESRIKTKQHLENMSKGISQAILDGKMRGYYKKSKRGTYLSSKAGEVYFRSAYELKAFVLLDEDENVISYKHDAFRVPYINEKNENRYFIIDLVVQYKDGSTKYIEVKPRDFMKNEEVIIKVKAAEDLLGDKFTVWGEDILGIKDPHTLYNDLIAQLNGRLKIK